MTNNIHGILLNPKTVLDIENLKEKSTRDELGFSKKINSFVNYVKEYLGENKSIVVGIYGDYGSGKSVFVNLVKENLKSSDKTAKFIIFPAWKYKGDGGIWRNFISYVSKALQDEEKHNDLSNSLYYTQEKLDVETKDIFYSISGLAFIGVLWLLLNDSSNKLSEYIFSITSTVFLIYQYHSLKRVRNPMSSLEEFEDKFRDIINNSGGYERIYITVENMDRCLPHHAIELLESLKAFLEDTKDNGNEKLQKQLIFLIPCDKEVIERAIKKECGVDLNASTYLDKLIQLPYDLPIPANKNYVDFVESLLNNAYKDTKLSFDEGKTQKRYFEYVIEMLKLAKITNPRKIKILLREWEMRFVNLDESIKYNNDGQTINLESALFLLKLLILKKVNPNSYESHLELVSMTTDLVKDASNLSEINKYLFKRGGLDDVFKILNRYASGTIYEGKINAPGNRLNEENNFMVYGNIKAKSFEDLQKFMLATTEKRIALRVFRKAKGDNKIDTVTGDGNNSM